MTTGFQVGKYYKVRQCAVPYIKAGQTFKCVGVKENDSTIGVLEGRFDRKEWSAFEAVEEVDMNAVYDSLGNKLEIGDSVDLDLARAKADKEACSLCRDMYRECENHPHMTQTKIEKVVQASGKIEKFVLDTRYGKGQLLCIDGWYVLPSWTKKKKEVDMIFASSFASSVVSATSASALVSATSAASPAMSLAQQTYEKDIALAKIAAEEREKVRKEKQEAVEKERKEALEEKLRQEKKREEEAFREKLAKDAEQETKNRQIMCKLTHKEMLRQEKRGDQAREQARKDSIYAASLKRKDDAVAVAHSHKVGLLAMEQQHEADKYTAKLDMKKLFWEKAFSHDSGYSAIPWVACAYYLRSWAVC